MGACAADRIGCSRIGGAGARARRAPRRSVRRRAPLPAGVKNYVTPRGLALLRAEAAALIRTTRAADGFVAVERMGARGRREPPACFPLLRAPVDLSASSARLVQQSALEAAPWVQRLARLGYGAKGVVYALVGALALKAATGAGGRLTDSAGALEAVLEGPFGRVLLVLVGVGLLGHVVWRWVQAGLDPERKGSDAKGLARRAGLALSGLLYAGLALEAARLARGVGSREEGGTAHWTGLALDVPFGRWLVGLVGLGVIAYGLYELYRAYALDIAKRLDLSTLGAGTRSWAVRLGRAGLASRGVVLGLVGWFFVRAAWQADAGEVRGLDGALRTVEAGPAGPWLLGAVAAGLLAYGLFQLVQARFRVIRAT